MRWFALGVLPAFSRLVAWASPRPAPSGPKRVLVFGDSNAWGWMPQLTLIPASRYPARVRWPAVMQATLGDGFEVVVDALPGRTTDVADPMLPGMEGAQLDGSAYLPAAIVAHMPLDLVVVMLGSNDLKTHFGRSASRIAQGAAKLVDIVQRSGDMFGSGWLVYPAPGALLVCPPPPRKLAALAEWLSGGPERAEALPKAYRQVAEAAGVPFLDAATVVASDGVDGIHFTEAAHHRLGVAMAAQVRDALGLPPLRPRALRGRHAAARPAGRPSPW